MCRVTTQVIPDSCILRQHDWSKNKYNVNWIEKSLGQDSQSKCQTRTTRDCVTVSAYLEFLKTFAYDMYTIMSVGLDKQKFSA